ncbi:MAG: aspartate/glutamate racemase family protein [Bacillota bacterium]|nr:aspartate/glutamate racemase family protein [Bacillota bacterium]
MSKVIYRASPGQVSYGEVIGIILLDSCAPYIPGDVANASTYQYPVRFRKVSGLTVERIFNHDLSLLEKVTEAAFDLKNNGVRAITGDCGFMAIYQQALTEKVDLPVFMSSLLQIPFLCRLIKQNDQIGIITANSESLTEKVLESCGANLPGRIAVGGMEKCQNFRAAFIEEKGDLNRNKVEEEVVLTAKNLLASFPAVRIILLECSVLPPYGASIQQATGLPVFDFITMIDYVCSAVLKKEFQGFM